MNKEKCIVSSGNVFKDLGFPNAEEMQAKASLAIKINAMIKKRKLSQKQAADVLDVDQPKISLLSRGQLAGFSLARLMKFLNALNQDIEIVVRERSHAKAKAGHLTVTYAHL